MNRVLVIALLWPMSALSQTAGEGGSAVQGSAGPSGGAGTPTLVRCDARLGTIAVQEPQDYAQRALYQFSLPSPTQMIRLIIQQSNCFAVVERGMAMQNLIQERQLESSAMLRQGQNLGKGQLVTADFVLTPDVMFKNSDAGAIGGLIGGFLGPIGSIIGGSLKFKEAQTTLVMSDVRSGLQVASAIGSSQATDFGIGGALGGVSGGGAGVGALGAYENTAEGKVVAVAFLDAYNQIVQVVKTSPELARQNSSLNVGEEGKSKPQGRLVGVVAKAKINGVEIYAKRDKKVVASKLKKGEEVVVLADDDPELIRVRSERGSGWVERVLLGF